MDSLLKLGRTLFGVAFVAFGIQYFLYAHTASQQVIGPPWFAGRVAVAWLMAVILFAAGLSIAANRNVRIMAGGLGLVLLVRILFIHGPRLVAAFHDPAPWTSGFEVVAMASGAWLLAAIPNGEADLQLHEAAPVARFLFAVSLVVFGVQHFMYANFIATLLQSWMPFHLFWAYFVGVAFFATALALIVGVWARVASTMLGVMFLVFFFSLHLPRVASASHNGNEWTSMFVALAMWGTSWIVSGSLRVSERARIMEVKVAHKTGHS